MINIDNNREKLYRSYKKGINTKFIIFLSDECVELTTSVNFKYVTYS